MFKQIITAIFVSSSAFSIAADTFKISSDSIIDGRIEKIHACTSQGGQNLNPNIHISNSPIETKYFAIIMDDPDAQPVAGKTWVHWNVFNVPAAVNTITTGKLPEGEVKNSSSSSGYEGMCPPNGVHTYNIAVFAMKEKIDAGGIFGISPITIEKFSTEFKDVIIQQATIQGKF